MGGLEQDPFDEEENGSQSFLGIWSPVVAWRGWSETGGQPGRWTEGLTVPPPGPVGRGGDRGQPGSSRGDFAVFGT